MTKTLERFQNGLETVPADVAWYLSDLGKSLGKQQLFAAQAPPKLKALKDLRARGEVECQDRAPARHIVHGEVAWYLCVVDEVKGDVHGYSA